jgi:uncharacterized repeat protein (TIGR03803 family)
VRTTLAPARVMAMCAILTLNLPISASVARARSSAFSVLYSFADTSGGAMPHDNLLADGAGNLYGVAAKGGNSNNGTSFKLSRDGQATILYSFSGGSDGGMPIGPLITDGDGNLYGTTQFGGVNNGGTVFKLTPNGTESVLYAFTDQYNHGIGPTSGVIADHSGNFYGEAGYGGQYDEGVVYKLSADGSESIVFSFLGGPDGSSPAGGLIMDAQGNLYGVTPENGANDVGTIFKLTPDGVITILYVFDFGDGGYTPGGPLIADESGNLYGTAIYGGGANAGTVFELTSAGNFVVLHTFIGGRDGRNPTTPVIRDAKGNLYGTTFGGGANDGGVVYELSPNGSERVLHAFSKGSHPKSGLIFDRAVQGNSLFGTSVLATSDIGGVVFAIEK